MKKLLVLTSLLLLSSCSKGGPFPFGGSSQSERDKDIYGFKLLNDCSHCTVSDRANRVNIKDFWGIKRADMYPFVEYTYGWFFNNGLDVLDDEVTDYQYGSAKNEFFYFFKYTFFVCNDSELNCGFNFNIQVNERKKSSAIPYSVMDILRVMVFENDPAIPDSHNYWVYAKDSVDRRYTVRNRDGDITHQAFISTEPELNADFILQEDDDHPLAESFLAGNTIIKRSVDNFYPGDMRRYTVVFWLEGEDPDAIHDTDGSQEESSLDFSISVSDYEN